MRLCPARPGRIDGVPSPWSDRAAAAEQAVLARHLRPLWGIRGTALGVVGWPPSQRERLFGRWHYWWQAQLLDCAVDAHLRAPSPARRRRVVAMARAHLIRNTGRWTNNYYDDMAWLALALLRAQTAGVLQRPVAIRRLTDAIIGAWSDTEGGIPWRVGDDFRNTPANGPAAILLARLGHLDRAQQTVDWIAERLHDATTGLVLDGLHPGREIQRDFYTYCQGVVLGAETELAQRSDPERSEQIQRRVKDLIDAVRRELATDDVLIGHGGGNGGLFGGILARYLALVAVELPATTGAGRQAANNAATLLISSAGAAWANRCTIDGLPLFGADWNRPALIPVSRRPGRRTADGAEASSSPERDLSVQLGGWMLMEAAATLGG